MQCGPALVIRVRVGALLEQPDPEVVVRVECRKCQRTQTARQLVVDIGSGGHQRTQRVLLIVANGEQQRREPTVGPRVQVGTCVDQCLCRRCVALDRGPHQRGLLSPPLTGIDVGTVCEQHLDGVRPARSGSPHQRGLACRQTDVRVGPGVEQHLEHRGAAAGGGHQHGCCAVPVRYVGARTGAQQQLGRREIIAMGRPVQRRPPVDVKGVRVCVVSQQGADLSHVARPHRVDQRHVAGCVNQGR